MTGQRRNKNKVDDLIQIIEENKGIIYKVVNSYCDDPNDQEDLVQEIIYHLLEGYDRFDHRSKVTTWMYRVALNVSISFYKKSKTRKKYISQMPEKMIQIKADENEKTMDPEIAQLQKFIQNLDELNRAIMIMYLDSNSHEEIAEVMDLSVSNVGTKIYRIKNQLKEHFKID
ncbi:MAG: sigma-70 family RNA polymerase sigma factor [Bacteroidetes bacterium]|jgi:RNA polymerase sigma-70 factor (ECF subfamily)|nr:sigma-70 family RNA polymerase sigma factor [Bacteroidota bacterium]